MKQGYKFVYSMLHEGNVFYIGCTADIHKRYVAHISGNNNTKAGKFIAQILELGKHPDIKIIDYLPSKQALDLEFQLITTLCRSGHSLLNSVFASRYSFGGNELPYCDTFKKRKNAVKAVKYKQDKYLFFFNHLEQHGHYITNHYPVNLIITDEDFSNTIR